LARSLLGLILMRGRGSGCPWIRVRANDLPRRSRLDARSHSNLSRTRAAEPIRKA
jgi:hypothetical protein